MKSLFSSGVDESLTINDNDQGHQLPVDLQFDDLVKCDKKLCENSRVLEPNGYLFDLKLSYELTLNDLKQKIISFNVNTFDEEFEENIQMNND